MVASFEAVLISNSHSRPLQQVFSFFVRQIGSVSEQTISAKTKDQIVSGLVAHKFNSGVREILSPSTLEHAHNGCLVV